MVKLYWFKTTVENPKGNDVYENMYGGYSISTLAASTFGPFGYYPDKKNNWYRNWC